MSARAAGVLCAALATGALAQSAPVPDAAVRTRVEQKEALVRRLLTDSPASARIAAGDNAQARVHLRDALARHESAVRRLAAADMEGAERDLNDAMWLAGQARQLVPDPARRAIEVRVHNAALSSSIESLLGSYRTHLARLRGHGQGELAADATTERIAALLDQARAQAAAERVDDANRLLLATEREVMRALGAVLGTATLDYAKRFETLAEEYAYESERNRDYEGLVPLARRELSPTREASQLMDRMVAANRAQVEQARKLAAQRQYPAALEALRKGTGFLQGALGAAGLAVPKEE